NDVGYATSGTRCPVYCCLRHCLYLPYGSTTNFVLCLLFEPFGIEPRPKLFERIAHPRPSRFDIAVRRFRSVAIAVLHRRPIASTAGARETSRSLKRAGLPSPP